MRKFARFVSDTIAGINEATNPKGETVHYEPGVLAGEQPVGKSRFCQNLVAFRVENDFFGRHRIRECWREEGVDEVYQRRTRTPRGGQNPFGAF